MIRLKTKEQIEQIRQNGIIASKLFKYLKTVIYPGITTMEIDKIAEVFIRDHKAIPSFKGYEGFPCSVCASVNEEIIHGIPCKRVLKEGDIIGIDVGVLKGGMISDSARTFAVGEIKPELQKLMDVTETALYKAISKVRPGGTLNDIGGTVEDYASQFRMGVVRGYCGHGVGFENHEDPEVPNYRFRQGKKKLMPGMVIAIEPMINLGDKDYFVLEDGWTVVTVDGSYSAHFENTVAVTENGYDILTVEPEDLPEIKAKFKMP